MLPSNHPQEDRRVRRLVAAVALAHLAILPLAQILLPTPQDLRFVLNWFEMADERGVFQVYSWTDREVAERFQGGFNANYPPLVFLIYYPAYRLLLSLGAWPTWPSTGINLFFRAPIAFGHWLLFVAVFRGKCRVAPGADLRCSLLFGLNPALLLAGPVWGQFDVLLWGLMFLSLTAQTDAKYGLAGIWAALAALLKPQVLLFVPLAGWVWLRTPRLRRLGVGFSGFLGTVLVVTSPFLMVTGGQWLRSGYSRVFNAEGGGVTSTAFNLWWLASHLFGVTDANDRLLGLSCKHLGVLAVAGVGGGVGFLYAFSRPRPLMGLVTIHLLACFLALTGLSERFLVFATASLCVWAVVDPRLTRPAIVLSCLQVVNLLHNTLYHPGARWGGFIPAAAAETVSVTAAFLTAFVLAWVLVIYIRSSPDRSETLSPY